MCPVAADLWRELQAAHPEWEQYLQVVDSGDIEVALPAPDGSRAGHLVLFTAFGKDLWLRFSPPQMCYPVDNASEMLRVAEALLNDEVVFVRITKDLEWAGTTLVKPDAEPALEPGQVADVTSWSGRHDKIA
jgi:hypothetical protein